MLILSREYSDDDNDGSYGRKQRLLLMRESELAQLQSQVRAREERV